jgi:hypothetical protein
MRSMGFAGGVVRSGRWVWWELLGTGKALPRGEVRTAFPLFPVDPQGSCMESPGAVYAHVVSHSPDSGDRGFVPRGVWESQVGDVSSYTR